MRLATGLAVFDTVLPIARGQRIGVFAGSGIGKSTLLADLARGIEAEIVVYALIGERGRELRDFVDNVLGPKGMERAVVVAATSDQAPLIKRRAAWMAMATAEVFRDQGRHVLLLINSLTRFAEAHREIALTAGEAPSLRGFPPSTANLIAALCERAGPGRSARATSPASSRAGRGLGHGRAGRRHHPRRARRPRRARPRHRRARPVPGDRRAPHGVAQPARDRDRRGERHARRLAGC